MNQFVLLQEILVLGTKCWVMSVKDYNMSWACWAMQSKITGLWKEQPFCRQQGTARIYWVG